MRYFYINQLLTSVTHGNVSESRRVSAPPARLWCPDPSAASLTQELKSTILSVMTCPLTDPLTFIHTKSVVIYVVSRRIADLLLPGNFQIQYQQI